MTERCPSCTPLDPADPLLVLADDSWTVQHGPADTTRAGSLKITSRRHLVDFVDLDDAEAVSFGPLLRRLDGAIRAETGAERVHLVSTRDRVQHFHAWLYPRLTSDTTRGTAFLDSPQSSTPAATEAAAASLRARLA